MVNNSKLRRKGVRRVKDIKNAMDHLKAHIDYPATKEDLLKACNELSDFSAEDKKWFIENLPEGTYRSADEVAEALGWRERPMAAM